MNPWKPLATRYVPEMTPPASIPCALVDSAPGTSIVVRVKLGCPRAALGSSESCGSPARGSQPDRAATELGSLGVGRSHASHTSGMMTATAKRCRSIRHLRPKEWVASALPTVRAPLLEHAESGDKRGHRRRLAVALSASYLLIPCLTRPATRLPGPGSKRCFWKRSSSPTPREPLSYGDRAARIPSCGMRSCPS